MSDNDTFRQYVTSTAFSLSLSANMIAAMEFIESCGRHANGWKEFARPVWGSAPALERRGLIRNLGSDGAELTEAGRLVLDLCRLAGLAGRAEIRSIA